MQSNAAGKATTAKNAAKHVTAKSTEASFTKMIIVQKKRKKLDPNVVVAEPQIAPIMAVNE